MNRSSVLVSALALAMLAVPQQVLATLGESADSIARDRHALSAAHRATRVHSGYTVQEVATTATTVREYVSVSGIVFAVTWQGITPPDLTPLLGSFASEYNDAASRTAHIPGHRRLQVKTARVIVEKWGQMRALQGRAYLPTLIPPGVSLDEIK